MQFLPFLLRVFLILGASEVVTGLVLAVFLPERGWLHEVAHFAAMASLSTPLLYSWVFRPLAGAVALRRLQEEHQFTLRLLDTAAVLVVVLDRHGRIVRFNREAERVSGYSADEVMGREVWFLIPPNLRDEVRGVVGELTSGGLQSRHENAWLTKDGDERLIAWSNATEIDSQGEVLRVIATGVDITERQAAQHQLSLFRAGMERSSEVIFLTDLDGTILYVNPMFETVYGYSPEEAVGQTPRILKSGVVPKELYTQFWGTLLAGGVLPVQIVNRRKDGSLLDVEGSANPITNSAGDIVAFLAIQRDVTERNKMLRALQASEERFRELLQETPVAMAALAPDGGIRYVNPALCELVGFDEEELVRRSALEFVHPDDRSWAVRRVARGFPAGAVTGGPARFIESRLVHRSGRTIPAEVFARPGELQGEPVLLVVFQDLTERRNLEDRLRQSMKMEAVGQLAGGVAHDFNNLLTVIQSNTELVAADHFAAGGVPEELTEVEAAVRRGKGLIERILAFSRKEGLTFSAVDPRELLEDLTPALRRLLPENIQIELMMHPDLPAIRAHPGSLEQVVINVATNARDAMIQGGSLSISVSPVQPDDWEMPGVAFEMRDTGVGMPPKVLRRIFDPFFTTKPVGIGTGLGLAAVYGLVKQHGGTVVVDSRPGVGTTVTFTVPGSTETPKALRPPRPSAERGANPPPDGREVVLVVEDDSALRRSAVRALRRLGYETVEAGNGREGLQRFKEHAHRIDLVLTDVVMPGMSGPAMAREILSEHPGTRLLFCSGYDSPEGEGEALRDGVPFLRKPWSLEELTREVRAALDDPSAPL